MDMQMQSDPAQGQESQVGYEICIRVDAQNQISVGVESASAESSEQPGGEQGESGYQSVESIDQALQVAGDIYKNSGQIDSRTDEQQAQAGYASKSSGMMPKSGMSAQKVFGE